MEYLAVIKGFVFGVLLIVFRNQIALFIENVMTRFPKYQDGESHFKWKYSVRPVYLAMLGSIFIFVALRVLLSIIT